ncbi:MAG: hypothetical protein FJ109_13865, partial [Deltaproteobacteria bacterium]|nr:hypothetical protein [Deltaproteobacteria bacterium]
MRERQLALHVCDPTWFQGQKAFLASHRLADVAAPARPVTDVEESSALFLRGLGEAALPSQCGRLYLGNEFCPYLAWSLDETLSACELAVDCGFELTLVSGAVRESAFAAAVGQVRSVVERFGAVEVVANDWGFLASLASLGARPVAGRLLFRSKRLPRLSRTP